MHLTSQDIFLSYIFPEIKNTLYDYTWIDLYCGEGNLIFPILEKVPIHERVDFFKEHIYLSDIQHQMVQKCIEKAQSYNIPLEIAENNIFCRDNLHSFPKRLKKNHKPLYHITNPPYLYLGYIRKHEETKRHLKYFENENEGYQDLYQIAMINDLRNELENLIYIIPSNFIFGASVSNKFRMDFLNHYNIIKMLIFETQIFDFTGTNICIGFFQRKKFENANPQKFKGIKFKKNDKILVREYCLTPEFKYRGGAEFDEFINKFKAIKPLNVKYYLRDKDVEANKGKNEIEVIDTNEYISNEYKRKRLKVNDYLKEKVKSNILYIRTVDTGSLEGRAGLNIIKEDFNVDGIYVSKATYRTSPIQIFLTPTISFFDQILLKNYFNLLLEYFREKLDSEFLTTYKYSNAEYTRKYLGLTQVRNLIETFPINYKQDDRKKLIDLLKSKEVDKVLKLLSNLKEKNQKNKLNKIEDWL